MSSYCEACGHKLAKPEPCGLCGGAGYIVCPGGDLEPCQWCLTEVQRRARQERERAEAAQEPAPF